MTLLANKPNNNRKNGIMENTRRQVEVTVEWCEKNYGALCDSEELGVIVATGKTLDECLQKFRDAIEFHIEGMVEYGYAPQWAVEGQYDIKFNYDTSALLRKASQYTTMAAVSRVSGINQKLLEHYASSRKRPRKAQQDKIKEALHRIGEEILAFS